MAFTDVELEYLTHEAQICGHEVLDDFYENVHNNIVSFREAYGHVPEANLYASLLRECAKGIVDAHIRQYVEISEELQKYPDGGDIQKLTDFTKPFITALLPNYRKFAERPLGENIPAGIVDATEKTLKFDLQTIFAKGLAPLKSLHMKGRVAEERMPSRVREAPERSKALPTPTTYNTFNGPVGAVQQGRNNTATITESIETEETTAGTEDGPSHRIL